MSSGVKHDSDKPDMSLLSPFALEEIAKVMTFGAKKYSANNWRQGFKYTRILAAVLRHLMAYQRGEAKDPETGLSHLAHASCGLMMLLEFEKTGAGENDVYWQSVNESKDITVFGPLKCTVDEKKVEITKRGFRKGQLVKHKVTGKTGILITPMLDMDSEENAWIVECPGVLVAYWSEVDFELA